MQKTPLLYETALSLLETIPYSSLICPSDIDVCMFEYGGAEIDSLKSAGYSLYSYVRRLATRYYFLKKRRGSLGRAARARYTSFIVKTDDLPTVRSVCR